MFYTYYTAPMHPNHPVTQEAGEARRRAGQAHTAAGNAEDRVERLALLTEALWVLLKEKTGATDEELLDKVREVDLSDGYLDGKVRRETVDCPSCGRTLAQRKNTCIYCGAKVVRGFDGL